jgi:hypothetical protein
MMPKISVGQMKLLHVAKQAGISHDELSMSTTNVFGVGRLDALGAGVEGDRHFPSLLARHHSIKGRCP